MSLFYLPLTPKLGCLYLYMKVKFAVILMFLEHENRCIMCRAEAHQLYSRKAIFDALGVQLFVVLHEHIDSEVFAYILQPNYMFFHSTIRHFTNHNL